MLWLMSGLCCVVCVLFYCVYGATSPAVRPIKVAPMRRKHKDSFGGGHICYRSVYG